MRRFFFFFSSRRRHTRCSRDWSSDVCSSDLGPDFILAVDANRGWSVEEAVRFARLVEHLDIRWFEEPCHWYDDVAMMARVRRATRIPITAGQSEITSRGVRRLIDGDRKSVV